MKRGDLVTVVLAGAYGKPRPALIIQSDLFAVHPSVTLAPVTSQQSNTPLFRIPLYPTPDNGLQKPSDVMIDKLHTVPREKIGEVFGCLSGEDMLAVSRSLALFLGVV